MVAVVGWVLFWGEARDGWWAGPEGVDGGGGSVSGRGGRGMSGMLSRLAARGPRAVAQAGVNMGRAGGARRGMAGGAKDPNEVDYPWHAPQEPSRWKSEHVVFATLAGWYVLIQGARTVYAQYKKEA